MRAGDEIVVVHMARDRANRQRSHLGSSGMAQKSRLWRRSLDPCFFSFFSPAMRRPCHNITSVGPRPCAHDGAIRGQRGSDFLSGLSVEEDSN